MLIKQANEILQEAQRQGAVGIMVPLDVLRDLIGEVERLKQQPDKRSIDEWALYYGVKLELEGSQNRVEELQKAIETAYKIACEDFESFNQMDLIRATLGEALQSIQGGNTHEIR